MKIPKILPLVKIAENGDILPLLVANGKKGIYTKPLKPVVGVAKNGGNKRKREPI